MAISTINKLKNPHHHTKVSNNKWYSESPLADKS